MAVLTVVMASLLVTTSRAKESLSGSDGSTSITWNDQRLATPEGKQMELATLKGEKATVVVFLSTECPVSNGYIPTLNQLQADFKKQGVRFIAIYSFGSQSAAEIAAHGKSFNVELPILCDPKASFARTTGVSISPEVVLFDATGRRQYRGRIDNRYHRRGGSPRAVYSSDLKDAITALLVGAPIKAAETVAIGCPIPGCGNDNASAQAPINAPTYHGDVARILQQRCEECHRHGGVAPFALSTYDQAKSWASDIVAYTRDGTMPPWKPTAHFGEFQNVRSIPADEIDVLDAWVKGGALAGDRSLAPPPRSYPEGWQLGTPDLVLSPSEDYRLSADGRDVYRNFVIPTGLEDDRQVAAYEIIPGNRRVVHHVLMFLDGRGASKPLDAADPGPGYDSPAGLPGFLPTGSLGGWAPGNQPHVLDANIVRILPAGVPIVMQVHYHKSGKEETDRTKIGIYFAKKPGTRAASALLVLPQNFRRGLRIPPGEAKHEVRGQSTIPVDLLAISVTPHMHLIGKSMKVWAELPGGKTLPLIEIRAWDFNWQETYNFKSPVLLPKGTVVKMAAIFDNSADNPNNPNQPPRLMTWGEQTTEEMCIAFMEVALQEETLPPKKLQPLSAYRLLAGSFGIGVEKKPR